MKMMPAIVLFASLPFIAVGQGIPNLSNNGNTLIKQPIGGVRPLKRIALKTEQAIPQNFYTQHLPFFCRQELKMQQAHVPVTFRLGSMDYCNYLEQKPGYR